MADPELQRDVEAALAARRELGPDYDDHVAAALAERIDQLVAIQLAEARVRGEDLRADREDAQSARTQRFVLGLASIGGGIPITAIAGGEVGIVGIVVAWAGIVGVNVASAWRRQR